MEELRWSSSSKQQQPAHSSKQLFPRTCDEDAMLGSQILSVGFAQLSIQQFQTASICSGKSCSGSLGLKSRNRLHFHGRLTHSLSVPRTGACSSKPCLPHPHPRPPLCHGASRPFHGHPSAPAYARDLSTAPQLGSVQIADEFVVYAIWAAHVQATT